MSQIAEFTSVEDVVLIVEPFIDHSTSPPARVSGDTLTTVVTKPDGTVFAGTVTKTQNVNTGLWTVSIAVADYISGTWGAKITSSAAETGTQFRAFRWGIGLAETLRLVKAKTDNLPSDPADASVIAASFAAIEALVGTPITDLAADIASVKTDTNGIASDASAAAASSASADTKATDIQTKVNVLYKLKRNRARIVGNQEIFYDDNGTTELRKFNCFDENGQPTSTRIFERVPVP